MSPEDTDRNPYIYAFLCINSIKNTYMHKTVKKCIYLRGLNNGKAEKRKIRTKRNDNT